MKGVATLQKYVEIRDLVPDALPGVLLGAGCTKCEVDAFLKKTGLTLRDESAPLPGDGSMKEVAW